MLFLVDYEIILLNAIQNWEALISIATNLTAEIKSDKIQFGLDDKLLAYMSSVAQD